MATANVSNRPGQISRKRFKEQLGSAKLMGNISFELIVNDFVIIRTKESSLMNKFGVRGYPTVFLLKNGKRTQYNGNRTVEDLKNFIGYVDPNPTPVPKSPGVGPLPEIKTNQTKPVPVPQSGSQKNETKFEPTKNETISDSQNTIGTPKPEKAITVATEDPKTSMNDAWLKVLIVGTIFLAFGMIFLFRRYIKQNRDTLSRLDTVEQEELEVEGP